MRYFSMFSGIGGFEIAIENCFVQQKQRREGNQASHQEGGHSQHFERDDRQPKPICSDEKLCDSDKDVHEPTCATGSQGGSDSEPTDNGGEGFTCVGYSEIDKYAIQIYRKHFPNHKNWGDARNIIPEELPDFDLLCAGFPCQSFSIAGKRKGFQDTRGTLFHEILRVVSVKRPRLLLLENVKGLFSTDDGRCFYTILVSLAELGYSIEWQILNSKDYGVPQNRERVFIVGHFGGGRGQQVFPLGETDTEHLEKEAGRDLQSGVQSGQNGISRPVGLTSKDIDKTATTSKPSRNTSTAIDANYWKGIDHHDARTMILHNVYGGFKEGIREFQDYSPTIRTPKGGGHLPMVAMRWQRSEKGKQARRECMQKGKDYTPFSDGHRELAPSKDDTSGCITNALNKDALIGNETRIRRLTPTECEKLQGFPVGYTEGVSDTNRYKCLGNAVTVNVVQAIMEKIIEVKA